MAFESQVGADRQLRPLLLREVWCHFPNLEQTPPASGSRGARVGLKAPGKLSASSLSATVKNWEEFDDLLDDLAKVVTNYNLENN